MTFDWSLFDGWRKRSPEAFSEAVTLLYGELYPTWRFVFAEVLRGSAGALDEDDLGSLSQDSFWRAMEDIDRGVAGGYFLTSKFFFETANVAEPVRLARSLLAVRGRHSASGATEAVVHRVRELLPQGAQRQLRAYKERAGREPGDVLVADFVEALNTLLRDPELSDYLVERGVKMTSDVRELYEKLHPHGGLSESQRFAWFPIVVELNRRIVNDLLVDVLGGCAEEHSRGVISHRKFQGDRPAYAWRGANKFMGLVREVWVRRGQDARRADRHHDHDELAEDLTAPEDAGPYKRAEVSDLKDRVSQMPSMRRQVMELRFFRGYSIPQIAEKLHMTEKNVQKHVERGRGDLGGDEGDAPVGTRA